MAHFERIRDIISGPFSPGIIDQRTASGWQLVSIEWRREHPASEAPTPRASAPGASTPGAYADDIPYGLRISDDCSRLERDPAEDQVLKHMMDLLAEDFPYSAIVSDLNEKGLRTRDGSLWSRVAVFNMMPRLIEIGPRLLSGEDRKRRQGAATSPRPRT